MATLYSIQQASHILNCNWHTLYRYHKDGLIHFKTMSNQKHRLIAAIDDSTLNYLKQIFDIYQNYPKLKTLLAFSYHHAISYRSLNNRIKKAKIKPNKIIKYKQFNNIEYYELNQLKQIFEQYQLEREHQTQYQIRYHHLSPKSNTENMYKPNQDFNTYQLAQLLNVNRQAILQWILYERVAYSYDKNHQYFFTPQQVQKIKHQYRNAPSTWLSNQNLAQKLNTKNTRLSRWTKYHRLKPHRILGIKGIYYDEHQIKYVQENYQNELSERK